MNKSFQRQWQTFTILNENVHSSFQQTIEHGFSLMNLSKTKCHSRMGPVLLNFLMVIRWAKFLHKHYIYIKIVWKCLSSRKSVNFNVCSVKTTGSLVKYLQNKINLIKKCLHPYILK